MDSDAIKIQIAENMRFFADMRFKQLTLFVAAMTAVAGGIVVSMPYRWWIALGGLCITAVMWLMEIRSTINFVTNYNYAPELWPRKKPKLIGWLTASHDVAFLYAGSYLWWLICVKRWGPTFCFSFYIGSLAGAVLLYFFYRNDHNLSKL
jgi:hypothetical protein